MKITFLGTGTSTGIPIIACDCRVCTSTDPRDKRRRASIHVEVGETHLVVDTPPDFRDQALTFRIRRVDAVLITHSHADHIFGLDDIRRYNTIQKHAIPVYGSAGTLSDIHRIFDYVRRESPPDTYRPNIRLMEAAAPFAVGPATVVPV